MSDLRVGADYHLAETRTSTNGATGRVQFYTTCTGCGYHGPLQDRRADAEADGYAHDVTENDG